MTNPRFPTYFLSHGGGPWPYMKAAFGGRFDQLEASLIALPTQLPARPKAVLVATAHWEAAQYTVSAAARPGMIYDYFGFPPHTYNVQYPAPGEPALARRVVTLLAEAKIPAQLDDARGFDHGTFCMLAPIYPNADIPVVQVSLNSDFSPDGHLAVGRALAPLRDEGILILGSGYSYHNLHRFDAAAGDASREFDRWLHETVLHNRGEPRAQRLRDWTHAPQARFAHPREEHLLPLMVAVGAAMDDRGTCVYSENAKAGGIAASSFRFGGDTP